MKQNIQRLLMMTFAAVAALLVMINAGVFIRGGMKAAETASERLFWRIEPVMAQKSGEHCIAEVFAAARSFEETDSGGAVLLAVSADSFKTIGAAAFLCGYNIRADIRYDLTLP